MLRLALRRVSSSSFSSTATVVNSSSRFITGSASKPSLSIWRRNKELGKEGLIITKELKRLQSDPVRLDRFVRSNVSRLLKSDLVSVLFEFQRQDNVFLSIKIFRLRTVPTFRLRY
ncbi:pentatricopeptide repeat-containing protein At1g62350-like isoform X2 [Trifolium pratense]|uniref:pentatricopeptide repeat-containing protein At1g62350-like isoform X2 n=1 Tax=Trifolium pratense TaxID=57577 RepID=UPI001E69332E|nr:pentatricopeptide repeat-containing protein At1g62350-like isoform X2 [Trifolium pratense]